MADESSPLLQFPGMSPGMSDTLGDHHHQFCHLVGVRPVNHPPGQDWRAHPESLYRRATRHRRHQNVTYMFTATFTNTLLLSQVILGATLTGLGASDSSRILITVFGALNTVIAGLVAFLKSRGQPVRARMFRDDLERVVDEIENSAVMWLGISKGVHGYDAIDTNDSVTVRSEVARLTRLYDRAVKNSTMNDPDNYAAGVPGDQYSAALRSRTGQPVQPPPTVPATEAPAAAPPALGASAAPAPGPSAEPVHDPDESPASKAPETTKPVQTDTPNVEDKTGEKPDVTAAKPDIKPTEDDKLAPSTSDAISATPIASDPETAKPIDSKVSLPETSAESKVSGPANTAAQASSGAGRDEPATAAKVEKHSEDTSKS
ncbi:hypothetical protein LTR78_006585 [Recurvomyces mirabilis]|uniref:SMODS and SLOG-associating 2TM effector domain-containing protein n=1 Tax=Recurvomyces mirabilis TaxID=574656 RepID=A0AAE0WL28_9PEZI|nr:hypothetical protein LTR78_006585 [Recurvomyces mirabilis]KAK5154681.1 hypothetical protein LTS14_006260 [Recurvomyces mirabilis]